jgi:membrane protease YdiL (CAAX protease family)
MLILQKNSFNKKDTITNAGFIISMALIFVVFFLMPAFLAMLGFKEFSPVFLVLSPSMVIIPGLCIFMYFTGKPGGLLEKFKLSNLRFGFIPISFAASFIFLISISWIVQLYHLGLSKLGFDLEPPAIEFLLKNCDFSTLIWLTVGVVFLAPISEELVFRRFMFGFLAPRCGFVPAMLITAAAFAGIHLSIYDLPALFLLGIAFQLIYLRFGSLYPAVLMHAFNNAIALNVLFLVDKTQV